MNNVPPLIEMSPEKVLPLFVNRRFPFPVLVNPEVPATTDEIVAEFVPDPLFDTKMMGDIWPVGAARVIVSLVNV